MLDGYTGDVLSVQKVLKPNFGHRIAKLIADLHFGTFGGVASQVLYVFVGLTPSVLFITGLTIFQQGRWLNARKKAAVQPQESTLIH